MNTKKRTQYLLIAVIAIYGAVVARFFMLSNDGDYVLPENEAIASFKPTAYTIKESFIIKNDYRDPFLGTLPKSNQRGVSSRKSSQKVEEAYFPRVHYLGIISDAASSKKVVSLSINSKEYVMKEGNTIDSVTVISGNTKHILVSYKGKRKRISISN